jgi:hypothetical protein
VATSSQAVVIDLLMQKVSGLGLDKLIGLPCPVFDGPEGTDNEDNYVVVHGFPQDPETAGVATWRGIGSLARLEEYDVAVAVQCFSGGLSPANTDDATNAQKLVRANARQIAGAIEQAILDDITLAGENGGVPVVTWILPAAAQSLNQAPPEGAEEMGRFGRMLIKCHIYNLLSGS